MPNYLSLFRAFSAFAGLCFLLLARNAVAQNQVKIEEKVAYLEHPNNIRMSNGTVELILATDYGPRIMRYALVGSKPDENIFVTIPGVSLKSDLGEWWIRGGHRLWHAPEAIPRTYLPDNDPVAVKIEGNTVKLIPPVEKMTGIQKEMWVTLDADSSHVTVTHRLTNKGLFANEMACWSLSAMNSGGMAIFPQEPYKSHDEELLPVRPMVLWSYTNLKDPRWFLGQKFITLRQDINNKEAQKMGFQNRQGWAAYHRKGMLFLKRFPFEAGKIYPDFGCNNETFTNEVFLEMESIGPLQKVEAGDTITHVEDWWLYPGVQLGNGEPGIASAMQPILRDSVKVK